MVSSVFSKLRLLLRRLWVRASLISALAIVAALLAPLSNLLPLQLKGAIDEQALTDLLDIITNSMLAVTTFSLSIMVTAHLSADKGATPRGHRLLQEDGRTQTVLATFVGAFLYGLTLTVIVNADLVNEAEYAIVYIITVGVIALIVIAIMRWIAHLDGLGSVEVTSERVEERAIHTIDARNAAPFLGAHALTDAGTQIPRNARAIRATRYGHIQVVQVDKLCERLREWGGRAYLSVSPGDWVHEGQTLCHVDLDRLDDEREEAILAMISIGDLRIWDQDMAFNLIVLAEIGERALSPGINDPRTGVDIAMRLTRLIARIAPEREPEEVAAPLVYLPPLDIADLMHSTLDRIARDGRAFIEVQTACQRGYDSLSRHPDPVVRETALGLSRRALAYAEDGLNLSEDLRRLLAIAPAGGPAETVESEGRRSAFNDLSKTGEDQQRGKTP